jgi:hypothetical protein
MPKIIEISNRYGITFQNLTDATAFRARMENR